jgi:putative oxidoreductase
MLQRLVTAGALVCSGIAHLHASPPPGSVFPQITEIAAGAFLLVGLWTPFMGAIVACREMWIVFSGVGDPWLPLILAALGASLAIIGPGAWSIDARLFGRKQIKTSSH